MLHRFFFLVISVIIRRVDDICRVIKTECGILIPEQTAAAEICLCKAFDSVRHIVAERIFTTLNLKTKENSIRFHIKQQQQRKKTHVKKKKTNPKGTHKLSNKLQIPHYHHLYNYHLKVRREFYRSLIC